MNVEYLSEKNRLCVIGAGVKMSDGYLTGKNYTWLCENCRKAIDDAHSLIIDGLVDEQYIDDFEGPCMLAYDKGWFRGCDCNE